MRLDPHTIARLASTAGFVADSVNVATAVALATSGGLTEYAHRVGIPGAGDYRGLWGIDVDRFTEYADVDLAEPLTSARAAYALAKSRRGWEWAPAYASGAYTGFLARAQAGRSAVMQPQIAHPYNAVPGAMHTIAHTQEAINRLRLAHAHGTTRKAPIWPMLTAS